MAQRRNTGVAREQANAQCLDARTVRGNGLADQRHRSHDERHHHTALQIGQRRMGLRHRFAVPRSILVSADLVIG
jgi:hypothetical protein